MHHPVPGVARTRPVRRWPLLPVLGILGLVVVLIGFSTRDRGDYLWYFRCAETAFLAGQNPYQCADYRNVPPTFLYMAPFGLLPVPYDAAAWSLVVVVCVCAGLWLLIQTLDLVEMRTVPLLALMILCPCTLFLLTYQQSTALVFVLEAGALWCLGRRRYAAAVVLLALTVFKPQLSLALLPLAAPLPRRYQALGLALACLIFVPITLIYLPDLQRALLDTVNQTHLEHDTLALRELTDYFSTAPWWRQLGSLWSIPPFLYVAHGIWRLWRARQIDLVAFARLVPAGLLWGPYSLSYDWVLLIFSYLVLWDLAGHRWTGWVVANVGLALVALPVSILTFLLGIPLSLNPVPLIVVIVGLHRLARQYPERAAALRWDVAVGEWHARRDSNPRPTA